MFSPSVAAPISTYPALDAEVEFLQIQLEHCSWLQSELDVTLAKLDQVSRPSVGSGGAISPREQSVCNFQAMSASKELHEVLSQWAVEVRKTCGSSTPSVDSIAGIAAWLIAVEGPKRLAAKPELFRAAYNAIVDAVLAAKDVVDLPAVDDYATAAWTRIPTQHKLRSGLIADPLDAVAAPATLTYSLAGYGAIVTTVDIATWGKDGKLEVHLVETRPDVIQKQYRLGDVLDVWLEREEKRARIAANRAAAEAKREARLKKFASMQDELAVAA